MSELAAMKNLLSHTNLPHPKQKSLPGSKGSAEMEVRRASLREDTQGRSLSLKDKEREGSLILRNNETKEIGVKWMEVGWEHTAGVPGQEGHEQLLQHFPETNLFLPIFQHRQMSSFALLRKQGRTRMQTA